MSAPVFSGKQDFFPYQQATVCVLLSNKQLETKKTLQTIQDKLSHEGTTSSGFPNVGPATRELVMC